MFMIEYVFFFKQKTAYEMRISDWSSDVCSSDLQARGEGADQRAGGVDGARIIDPARRAAARETLHRPAMFVGDRLQFQIRVERARLADAFEQFEVVVAVRIEKAVEIGRAHV